MTDNESPAPWEAMTTAERRAWQQVQKSYLQTKIAIRNAVECRMHAHEHTVPDIAEHEPSDMGDSDEPPDEQDGGWHSERRVSIPFDQVASNGDGTQVERIRTLARAYGLPTEEREAGRIGFADVGNEYAYMAVGLDQAQQLVADALAWRRLRALLGLGQDSNHQACPIVEADMTATTGKH